MHFDIVCFMCVCDVYNVDFSSKDIKEEEEQLNVTFAATFCCCGLFRSFFLYFFQIVTGVNIQ